MTADTITAIATTAIAFSALYVSIWERIQSRRHNRLTVVPKLHFSYSFIPGGKNAGLILRNHGLGPAIIKKFEIYVGDVVTQKWEDVFSTLKLEPPPLIGYLQYEGDVFAAGRTQYVLALPEDHITHENIDVLKKILGRINVVVEYESLYGENFKAMSERDRP